MGSCSSQYQHTEEDNITNFKEEPSKNFNQSCYLGYINNVIWYLENGENVHEIDKCGRTPLHLACFLPTKYGTDVIKILLQYGSDPNKVDIYEQAPLHYACENGLSNHSIQVLISGGSDVNIPDKYGNTSLHIAAKNGFVNIVDFLLRNGAISQRNYLGKTPYESTPGCFKKDMIFLKY